MVLVLTALFACFTSNTFAIDIGNVSTSNELVTITEYNAVKTAMETRNIGGLINVDILYDHHDNPEYLLGTSALGYQILAREALICLEGGTINPYRDFMQAKKYYGGFGRYYADVNNDLYDILRNEYTSVMIYQDNIELFTGGEETAILSNIANTINVTSYNATLASSDTVVNSSFITTRAFGYNNDNTCSAIACTLILNYLDALHNGNLVPSQYNLEIIDPEEGIDEYNYATEYPKAHAFHRFLADTCGMGPASFGSGITNAITNYRARVASGTGLALYINAITEDLDFVYDEIAENKPVLMTIGFVPEAGNYSRHTIPIYGYRAYSDNSAEFLVHSGWLDEVVNGVHPAVWLPAAYATLYYRFTWY